VELERGNKVIAGISPVGRKSSLSAQGQMIGAHDLIIAATAIVHNCAVLTENIKELERVPGLETILFVNPS
jgi:predicted nucleic acid-binding protein